MYKFPSILATLGVLSLTAALQANNIDSVTDYDPGAIDASNSGAYQLSGNAAVGLPATTDGYGTDVTPFTPPWQTSDLTEIGAGGHITLHFAAPITNTVGPQIGVFVNTGIVANYDPTSGAITASASTFSPPSIAIVSVSQDGNTFIPLNAGNPITLDNPTSAFSDSQISYDPVYQYVSAVSGMTPNSFFKPFTGTLDDFTGDTYAQMNTLLNGSAGGTWLDVSSAGLSQINYIRFDVPDGDDLILDAVTAVPEPASLGILLITLVALARRKQR